MAKKFLWEESSDWKETEPSSPVVVTDIHMRFSSMVLFMLKWALASIPALVVLMVVVALGAVGMLMVIDVMRELWAGLSLR